MSTLGFVDLLTHQWIWGCLHQAVVCHAAVNINVHTPVQVPPVTFGCIPGSGLLDRVVILYSCTYFSWPHSQQMEVPGPGIESEL